jgi:hypothetical protein
MWITRCVAIAALLLAPGLGLWGCSDDTDKPLDLGVTDTSQLPDGPSVDKRIFLDAPPFLDQGPDMAPDMAVAVDAAVDTVPVPDKSCGTGKIACNCIYKGIKLYGKYKIVTFAEDIKIKEVTFAQDLKVEKTNFPNKCGQWKEDNTFPDFKVKIVTFAEDIKVKYVTFNPGL